MMSCNLVYGKSWLSFVKLCPWMLVSVSTYSPLAPPCAQATDYYNYTRNSLGHAVFKYPHQWREAFSPDVADIFCGNARGRLWWSDSSRREAIDTMVEKMGQLTLVPRMLYQFLTHTPYTKSKKLF